jgi:hypothetical protein
MFTPLRHRGEDRYSYPRCSKKVSGLASLPSHFTYGEKNQWYPPNKSPGGPHSEPGIAGEAKIYCPYHKLNPRSSSL